jgi:hypothetical protein
LLDELSERRAALDQRKQPDLLRLQQTKPVRRLVAQQFPRDDWTQPDEQGCQMVEAKPQKCQFAVVWKQGRDQGAERARAVGMETSVRTRASENTAPDVPLFGKRCA